MVIGRNNRNRPGLLWQAGFCLKTLQLENDGAILNITNFHRRAVYVVKRKLLVLLALLLCMMLSMTVEAAEVASGTCGDNLTWVLDEETTLTISGSGEMYDYTITSSGSTAPWASYKEEITTILIDEGVTSIGSFSFALCENLKDISLPESLLYIEEAAFYQCYALTQLSLPNGLQEIGKNAFHSNNLSSVHLGAAVQTIGKNPFYNNKNLQIFTVAEGNMWYYAEGNVLFCKETMELICYPKGLTQTSYTVPSGIIAIGENGFAGNSHIKTVVLADSVISLKSGAFSGCTSLYKLDLPSNLQTIEEVALGDTALEQLFIPASLKTIENSALTIKTLKSITFEGNAPVFSASTFGFAPYNSITATIYYPSDNATWPEEIRQNYGGTITWVPYCPGEHAYAKPVFDWQGNENCTATVTCSACGKEQNVSCTVNAETVPATETKEGKITYTATAVLDGKQYTDAQTEILPKLEHTHSFAESWLSDKTNHWKQCSACGEKKDISNHIPGDKATENKSQKCTICGHVLRTPLGLDWFFEKMENSSFLPSGFFTEIMEHYGNVA